MYHNVNAANDKSETKDLELRSAEMRRAFFGEYPIISNTRLVATISLTLTYFKLVQSFAK